ncbi:unnamed protein product [Adineta steineri]|uniref:Condensation domain-containing protein n=1 Tax=Adineta steineri TaxID=433720 RepID=A0A814UPK0_9BILA|nr:unnamed protein product [Adineta steineri]
MSTNNGVFKCYRGDPILTSRTKVILPDISTTNSSYVRTGDLCRYNKDGDIVYAGREDFRVKIYGQLVEPEVIEQIVLKTTDLVKACIVRKEQMQEVNNEYLSCHLLVTSDVDSQDLIHQIEVYCRQHLPSFMVPVAWQIHSEFPLTPSGKIARKQLGEIKPTNNIGHIQTDVSIKRLRQALQRVIHKHAILHTSFHLNTHTNKWFQRIEPLTEDNEGFAFVISEGVENYDEISRLITGEFSIQGLFDTERGQLVRLHVVRRTKTPLINEDLLQVNDIIIFSIRHEAIDGSSVGIFLSDLAQSYDTGKLMVDSNAISYLDYTIYQSGIDRSASIAYWETYFDGIGPSAIRAMSRIPSDRSWSLNPYKITMPIPIIFHLDNNITSAMIKCARENNVTIANLCLSCHYAFLIQLTDEWDHAVDCNVVKRPLEPEAANIVGPFVDYIACRVALNEKTNPTFCTLLEKTHNTMMEAFDHLFVEEDPLSKDLTEMLNVDRQCSDFQFDEMLQDVTLDNNARLQLLLNPSDGMPAAIWWRLATDTHFGAYVIYDSKIEKLSYAFVFSTATYEQSTAIRYATQFQAMLERIFGEKTRPIDHQIKPLSFWLKQATTTFN